jgi:hypothetical protein
MLALVPDGEQPRSRIVGPKLSCMDERIATIRPGCIKARTLCFLCPQPQAILSSQLIIVEKAEDELYHRQHGSPARRCAQRQRMALSLLRANVDYSDHGKVRCVDLKHHPTH